MGGEWGPAPLGEVVRNFDSQRIPLSSRERAARRGRYRYFGATGVMDWVDGFLFEGLHLLMAEDGSVEREDGRPFLQLVDGPFWVNNHAHVLKGHTDADTTFLYYALSTVAIRPYISGSVQAKLSQGNLNRILVPYPANEADRKAIAQTLRALDDKIDLNRRMSETLEAMARGLFKSWFVDFDPVRAKAEGRESGLGATIAAEFPKFFGDSERGKIPTGWRWRPVLDLADVRGGSTPKTGEDSFWSGGDIAWATPKDMAPLTCPVLLETERRITPLGLDQIGSGLLPRETVLMSSRAPIGYLAIAEVPLAVNQGIIAMVPKHGVPASFLLRWAESAQDDIVSRANGSTFLEISKGNFRSIPVLDPGPEVLAEFGRIAGPLHDRVANVERESRTLAALRDALLPKLISGELRIPDAERIVGEVA